MQAVRSCPGRLGIAVWLAIGLSWCAEPRPASAAECAIGPQAYGQRLRLEGQYASAATTADGKGRITAESDAILARIREIDRCYFVVMDAMAKASAAGAIDKLRSSCAAVRRDPVLPRFCALLSYVRDRSQRSAFLRALPERAAQLPTLWVLDEMAVVNRENVGWVEAGVPGSVVEVMLDELMTVVRTGDRLATQRYMVLFGGADGGYAEFMVDQLLELMASNPELLVRQWPVLRGYRERLYGLSEHVSPERWSLLAAGVRAECAGTSARCREIRATFR